MKKHKFKVRRKNDIDHVMDRPDVREHRYKFLRQINRSVNILFQFLINYVGNFPTTSDPSNTRFSGGSDFEKINRVLQGSAYYSGFIV